MEYTRRLRFSVKSLVTVETKIIYIGGKPYLQALGLGGDNAPYEFKIYRDDTLLAIVSGKFEGKSQTPFERSLQIITNEQPTHVVNTSTDKRIELISFN